MVFAERFSCSWLCSCSRLRGARTEAMKHVSRTLSFISVVWSLYSMGSWLVNCTFHLHDVRFCGKITPVWEAYQCQASPTSFGAKAAYDRSLEALFDKITYPDGFKLKPLYKPTSVYANGDTIKCNALV